MKTTRPAMAAFALILSAALFLASCESDDDTSMGVAIRIPTDISPAPGLVNGAWGGRLNEIGMGFVLFEEQGDLSGVYQDREGWQGTLEGTRSGSAVAFTTLVTNGMDIAEISWNGTVNDELTQMSGTYLIRGGSGAGFGSEWVATKFEELPPEEEAEDEQAEENPET